MSTLQLKWLGMAALVGLSLLLLSPSMLWYSTDTVERDRLEAARQRPTWLINLGLDSQAGRICSWSLRRQNYHRTFRPRRDSIRPLRSSGTGWINSVWRSPLSLGRATAGSSCSSRASPMPHRPRR